MKTRNYWLRGLITGIIIYALGVLVAYIMAWGDEWGPGFAAMIAGIYLLPVIFVSLLIGWAWGSMRRMFAPIILLVVLAIVFLPFYNGRTICGINPDKGCWNLKVNLIGYINEMGR